MQSIDPHLEQQIIAELDGRLDDAGQLALNRALLKNPAARQQLDDYRHQDQLAAEALVALLDQPTRLAGDLNNLPAQQPERRVVIRVVIRLTAAAAVLALTAFTGAVWWSTWQPSVSARTRTIAAEQPAEPDSDIDSADRRVDLQDQNPPAEAPRLAESPTLPGVTPPAKDEQFIGVYDESRQELLWLQVEPATSTPGEEEF